MNLDDFEKWEKILPPLSDSGSANFHMRPMPKGFDSEIIMDGKPYYLRIRDAIAKDVHGDIQDVLAKDAAKNGRDVPSMIRYIVEKYYAG